ncbi:MAG: glycosyltransferase family 2 protein [Bacteroidales bacterium]|nr:glycosyltransferase family 2 protein [Bacteroidales bacterium]
MKIDVVIPCHNVGPFVDRCIRQLLNQTLTDWRAICVNNGSTDDTLERLRSHADADPRIVVVDLPEANIGLARNTGLDLCTADYVYYFDADDMLHPQLFEIAAYLLERDGSDIVTFKADSFYRKWQLRVRNALGLDSLDWLPLQYRRRFRLDRIPSFRTDDLLPHCYDTNHPDDPWPVKHVNVWMKFFRREVAQSVRTIENSTMEDVAWWSEMLAVPRSATITKLPLYYYYINNASIIQTVAPQTRVANVLRGLEYSKDIYLQVDPARRQIWKDQLMVPILASLPKHMARVPEGELKEELQRRIQALMDL